MKRVAYITSGKVGIHRFTFNELSLLEKENILFFLCLTQLNKGPCMPKNAWRVIIASKTTAIKQFILLLTNFKLIKLFFEAKRKKNIAYFFIALSFYNKLKDKNIDIIHCQMGDDKLFIGYYLKSLMNIQLTVTVHAHELYQRKVYDENHIIKELYSHCHKVITISNFNKEIIMDKFGVEKDKIEVMRLFPDIDHKNYVKDKSKILIVANWVEKKGYKTLFKAIHKLNRDDFVLWIVGGPTFSHDSINVEELVNHYNLKDKVVILGSQSSPLIDIIFNSCDIFCLPSITDYYDDGNPSEREGIPVALMEAMAWGKPVIATKHAGNSELVKEKLIEENNVEQLSNEINFLLDNPKEWETLGKKNKKIIRDKYSKSNINILTDIFKKIN